MIKKILLTVAHVMLIGAIILSCVEFGSFDRNFYYREYEKLEIAQEIQISFDELMKAMDVILAYTDGSRADMYCPVVIKGKITQFYNQDEMDHMVDVKELYNKAIMVRNIFAVAGLAILLFLYKERKLFRQTLLWGLEFMGAIVAAIGIFAWSDFSGFWTAFHYALFDNELWLLNPATDNLIVMMPLQVFNDLVGTIFLYSAIAVVVYCILIVVLGGKSENKRSPL